MTVYTGATSGNIVASYDTPDDGEDITAASVNVALHGLTDDMGRVNGRAPLSGRSNTMKVAFAPLNPGGIGQNINTDTTGGVASFTTAAFAGWEVYEWTYFDGSGGNTRTITAGIDLAYLGLVRRLSWRANASNSGLFYLRNGLSSGGNEDIIAVTPSTTLHVWADLILIEDAVNGVAVPRLIACSAGVAAAPSAYGTVP
jgi:hypothetical protein